MLKKLALGVAALAFCIPAGAALAHDDDDQGSFYNYWQHARDHHEHGHYHADEARAHEEAHEQGFYSPEEHAYWHERARQVHREFHEDHPNTWHDHYRWRRPYNEYRGYSYDYGYRGY